MQQHNSVLLYERFLAAASYLTLGLIGMLWFLFNHFAFKKQMSAFLTYNIVQSFLLSIIYAILTSLYNIFIGLLISIPFIGKIFLYLHNFLFNIPIFYTLNFINFIILICLLYLSLFALFAKLPFIPYITNIAKSLYR